MDKICKGCHYNRGYWCNRLVISGGMGMHDRVASDYLKDNKCNYFEAGHSEPTTKPNFENS